MTNLEIIWEGRVIQEGEVKGREFSKKEGGKLVKREGGKYLFVKPSKFCTQMKTRPERAEFGM